MGTEPSWFPDSRHVSFTSDRIGKPEVYKTNINLVNDVHCLTWGEAQHQNAEVSHDGQFIVMVRSKKGKQNVAIQNIVTGNVKVLSSTLLDETPSISPNDTMVVYSSSKRFGSAINLV